MVLRLNKKAKKRFYMILILIFLLGLLFLLKKTIPQKIGHIFQQLDQAQPQKREQKPSLTHNQKKSNFAPVTPSELKQSLCDNSNGSSWPSKKNILQSLFGKQKVEPELIFENIYYSNKNDKIRIVRKTNSGITLFEEDQDGFPSPILLNNDNKNQDSQIFSFIKGYQKKIIQRLTEFTSLSSSTSLLIQTEDNEMTEIKINTSDFIIECEDNQCRCDSL